VVLSCMVSEKERDIGRLCMNSKSYCMFVNINVMTEISQISINIQTTSSAIAETARVTIRSVIPVD